MTASVQIGARLRAARIAAGYKSLKDFVTQHGIPASTYTQHETGSRGLDPETVQTYSELLHINEAWLLTGQGRVFRDSSEITPQIPERELAYVQEMNKLVSRSLLTQLIDVDFLAEILTELIKANQNKTAELPIKSIIDDALSLYVNIISSSDDKTMQSTLLKTALHAYLLLAKK